jgi:hypothetical protein
MRVVGRYSFTTAVAFRFAMGKRLPQPAKSLANISSDNMTVIINA